MYISYSSCISAAREEYTCFDISHIWISTSRIQTVYSSVTWACAL